MRECRGRTRGECPKRSVASDTMTFEGCAWAAGEPPKEYKPQRYYHLDLSYLKVFSSVVAIPRGLR